MERDFSHLLKNLHLAIMIYFSAARNLYSCQLFYYLRYTLEIKERSTADQTATIKQT